MLPIASLDRLQRGLQGYLILFDTHAFTAHRQFCPSKLPSLLVFHAISTNSTSPLHVPLTSDIL
jgi:hypothetical protein